MVVLFRLGWHPTEIGAGVLHGTSPVVLLEGTVVAVAVAPPAAAALEEATVATTPGVGVVALADREAGVHHERPPATGAT